GSRGYRVQKVRLEERGHRPVEHTFPLVGSDQLGQLTAEGRPAGAGLVEEHRALEGGPFEGGRQQLLQLVPSPSGHRPSSRLSQARARVHSRLTVAGEISSTS